MSVKFQFQFQILAPFGNPVTIRFPCQNQNRAENYRLETSLYRYCFRWPDGPDGDFSDTDRDYSGYCTYNIYRLVTLHRDRVGSSTLRFQGPTERLKKEIQGYRDATRSTERVLSPCPHPQPLKKANTSMSSYWKGNLVVTYLPDVT